MATDRFRKMEEDANTTVQGGVSLLKTAVGLSPVAAGIWYGQRNLKANEALNSPIARTSPQQAIGKAKGLNARRAQRAKADRATAVAAKLREGLRSSDELRGIINSMDQHKALLQTLSVTLDNPANGLDVTAVQSLKSEISALLSSSTPQSVEEFAERVTSTLLQSGTPDALIKFSDDLSDFQKISGQLQTPSFDIPKAGMAVNPIDMGSVRQSVAQKKGSSWQRRLARLEGIVG